MKSSRSPGGLLAAGTLLLATLMASALMGAAATAAPATGSIVPVGPAVVADSFIVVLKDTPTMARAGVDATARGLARQYGGRIGHTYRHALRGFEVGMGEPAARRLAANPAVAYVQRNGVYRAVAPPPWGLDRVDQRNLPLNSNYSYPSVVDTVLTYVIDTGIRFSHNDFGGRAVSGFDAIDGGSADDGHGHGTHVAGTVGGTIHGVARGVTLVSVRVLNNAGSGTSSTVVAGVDWVTGHHPAGELAVANMSLGFNGIDPATETAVNNSMNDGITYVVAAGNSGADACAYTPARIANAITVGATDQNDARPSWSNVGTCLDLFAPGVDVKSTGHTDDFAVATKSGTSMAAPHVTGAAALVLAQHPAFTFQHVRDYLVTSATAGVIANVGAGSPNRLLFVGPPPSLTLSISGPSEIGSFAAAGPPDEVRVEFVPPPSEVVTYTAVHSGFMPYPMFAWSERFCWAGSCPGWTSVSATSSYSRTLEVNCSDDGNQYQVRLVMTNTDGRTATATKITYLCGTWV